MSLFIEYLLISASLGLDQRPDADGNKANAGQVLQCSFTDVLRNRGARNHADCRGDDKSERSADENSELAGFLVRREQHGRKLRLIAKLGNENRGEYCSENFEVHLAAT